MQKRSLNSIIYLFFIILIACRKNNESPQPIQKGTFSMQINGQNWTPNNYFSIFGRPEPTADIFIKRGLLRIYVYNLSTHELFEVYVDNVKNTGRYHFTPVSEMRELYNDSAKTTFNYECDDSTRFEGNFGCLASFKLLDSLKSEIIITKLDTLQNTIAGNFWITLTNDLNNKLEITNGIFEIQLSKD